MTHRGAGLHPGASSGAEFPFPDRNPGLNGLYSGATGLERLGAMGSRGRDDDGDVPDPESSNSMAEKDLGMGVFFRELLGNALHFAFGHGAIGLVFQAIHSATAVVVPDDA